MTGGRVVVLGETGRNFGAGMSGGIAFIWDRSGNFEKNCNKGTVLLEPLEDRADIKELKSMIEKHAGYTGSTIAQEILSDWSNQLSSFVKVMPTDYKRVLEEMASKNIAV